MSFLTVERTIENSLFDFVVEASSLTSSQVFWANTGFVKPKKTYITIANVGFDKVSHGREVGYDVDDKAIIDADYEVSFLLTTYRDDPAGNYSARSVMMEIAHACSDTELVFKHFSNNGIGYARQSNIAEVSVGLDNIDFEKRFRMTLDFNITIRNNSNIATSEIDTVNFDATVETQ